MHVFDTVKEVRRRICSQFMQSQDKQMILARKKLETRVKARFRKALNDYALIDDGDRILVGLSGGKDSLALLHLLGEQSHIYIPRFEVVAAHVSVANIGYQSDLDYLQEQCDRVDVPFHHITTDFDETVEPEKSKCFICSWQRRKALFKTAQGLNCNKIALGHHMDDVVETLLLNMVYQGTMGTMPPKLKMDKFDATIIRPLCLNVEQDLQQWADCYAYKKQIKNCPFERETSRTDVKILLDNLKQQNPHVLQTIWRSMENVRPQYLPKKK